MTDDEKLFPQWSDLLECLLTLNVEQYQSLRAIVLASTPQALDRVTCIVAVTSPAGKTRFPNVHHILTDDPLDARRFEPRAAADWIDSRGFPMLKRYSGWRAVALPVGRIKT